MNYISNFDFLNNKKNEEIFNVQRNTVKHVK